MPKEPPKNLKRVAGTHRIGVADGVGEWQWRFGLDPRAFADELMPRSKNGVLESDCMPTNAMNIGGMKAKRLLLRHGARTAGEQTQFQACPCLRWGWRWPADICRC